MKNIKLWVFSIVTVLLIFMSCTNEETIIDPQPNTQQSESLITSLNRLINQQYDENGNVDESLNPAGNIVFDFCFDFVFPIELSYNTGTLVTVNSLDELIDIYIASTDNLFINGIAFPFQVETYNENSNAIEIETINSEDEFFNLLENCGFEDDVEDCICTEEYDPVCIDINDLNGGTFTISYPNACFAICDGFTEDDFNEECDQDYETGAGDCFEFVYPISITLDEGDALTINSSEELFNAIYGAHHIGLVFPLDIVTEDDNTIVVLTINSYDELEAVIEDCYGDGYGVIDCSIEDITSTLVNCFWQIDFVDDDQYLYNFFNDGTYQVQSDNSLLTSGVWNVVAGNDTFYITLSAELAGYSDEWVVTVCDESLEMQSLVSPQAELYPIDCNNTGSDCSIEAISVLLSNCLWEINFGDNQYVYYFSSDGTFELHYDNNLLTVGTVEVYEANNAYIIELNAGNTIYNDSWIIIDCNEEDGLTIESINYPEANIYTINCV